MNNLLLRKAREVWEVIQEVVPQKSAVRELERPGLTGPGLAALELARCDRFMEGAIILPVMAGRISADRVPHTLAENILILNPTADMVFIKNWARVPVR